MESSLTGKGKETVSTHEATLFTNCTSNSTIQDLYQDNVIRHLRMKVRLRILETVSIMRLNPAGISWEEKCVQKEKNISLK